MDYLAGQYQAHHAWGWSRDPYTEGAFALFAPGQFKNLYPEFLAPLCGNKLMICGEAMSAHHAWISGALDSAYNAVLSLATANGWTDMATQLQSSPFGAGSGNHTQEIDENVLYYHVTTPGLGRQK